MTAAITWFMRHGSAILFVLSVIVFAVGVLVAFETARLTSEQASNVMLGGIARQATGIARVQLLSGVAEALRNAIWPFAAAALVYAVQSRSSAELTSA